MVVVHTPGIRTSAAARKEVKIALQEGMLIIPFVQNGHRESIFHALKSKWSPIEFCISKPELSCDKLLLEVLRGCLRRASSTTVRRVQYA